MTEPERIKKLNRRFADAYGWISFGDAGMQPRYKWLRTETQQYWINDVQVWEDGSVHPNRDIIAMPSGVMLTMPVFKRQYWADIYGPGWIVGVWKPPISEAMHENMFGPKVPWPKHGDYQPIETLLLNPGRVPSEATTMFAIEVIRQNLGKSYEDHVREGDAIVERDTQEKLDRIGDEMDDMLDTPSLRVGKDSVSFGGI